MPSVAEASGLAGQLGATLRASTETLSQEQEITFQLYVKLTLPLDGYVFWVNASTITPGAMLNTGVINGPSPINGPPQLLVSSPYMAPRISFCAKGSLHYQTTAQQTDEANYSLNQIVFTSETDINDLNFVSPTLLYIGTWQGVRFAFSERRQFYQQAGIRHYGGVAVTAVMATQILDEPFAFDATNVVVSNSLPLWLSMNQMQPPIPFIASQNLPLYPSALVPQNAAPPYGVVNVVSTKELQPTPVFDRHSNTWQLVTDEVEIVIYGYRNFNAMDFRDYVYNVSTWYNVFGVMNSPIIQDVKEGSKELQTLSMKKKITFQINYYQQRMRHIARQYVESVIAKFITTGTPPTGNILQSVGGYLLTTAGGFRIGFTAPPPLPVIPDDSEYLTDNMGNILTSNGDLLVRS